jgi:outer membrane protein assembly factor BamB
MLTAFKRASGEVIWRLNSIGISKIQIDKDGHLYLNTTDATPDELKYSEQINIFKKTQPVFMKVDSQTGKVRWKTQYIGDNCFISGKFIYASKGGADPLSSLSMEGGSYNYHLYGIKPSNGRVNWDHYEPRLPVRLDAHENWIMLHFRGELQVLKFLSL